MTGGLMQLVAYGAQDIYLTGNPTITYFKTVYRRHTNFSVESIQQHFITTPRFGSKTYSIISRNGDLMLGAYLQVVLPDLLEKAHTNAPQYRYTRWINNVGHYLVKEVSIEIGGNIIDRHFGDWLDVWAQLTVPASKTQGYLKMIGQDPKDYLGQNTGLQKDVFSNSSDPTVSNTFTSAYAKVTNVLKGRELYIPLQFWFCRNEGLALPLIALHYQEIRLNFEFRSSSELIMVNRGDDSLKGLPNLENWIVDPEEHGNSVNSDGLVINLWVDYVFLDTDERRRFAQVSHEYLMEQVQTLDTMISTSSDERYTKETNIELFFNHPVKELIWILKPFDGNETDTVPYQFGNYTNTSLPVIPPYTDIGFGNVYETRLSKELPAENNTNSILVKNGHSFSNSGFIIIEIRKNSDGTIASNADEWAAAVPYDNSDYDVNENEWEIINYQSKLSTNTKEEFFQGITRGSNTSVISYHGFDAVVKSAVTNETVMGLTGLPMGYIDKQTLQLTINIISVINSDNLEPYDWEASDGNFQINSVVPITDVLINSTTGIQVGTLKVEGSNTRLEEGDILMLYNAETGESINLTVTGFNEYSPNIINFTHATVRYNTTASNPVEANIYKLDDTNGSIFRSSSEIILGENKNAIETRTTGLSKITKWNQLHRLTNYDTTRPINKYGYASNPIDYCYLSINNHERFKIKPGNYFNWMQCFRHHTNIPKSPGINVYSFALNPEEYQPSGTCNFSRLDNARLTIGVGSLYYGITGIENSKDGQPISTPKMIPMRIFAVNYNILRIMSGMAGLAYQS